MSFAANTIARATVRGVPNVLVLRRNVYLTKHNSLTGESAWHQDWAHSSDGIGYTCSNDHEVTDIRVCGVVEGAYP